jgi:hypothetical protein
VTAGPAAIVTMAVLSCTGVLPAIALVGPRLVSVPLMPLIGAVVAALAATGFTAVGGSLIGWFVGLAGAAALAVLALWRIRPELRPWGHVVGRSPSGRWPQVVGLFGAFAILGACLWCLRGLATPTVGFDARALWLMRAGWFLQSHHQLLDKMQVKDVVLIQTPYPPLVSAVTALGWYISGDHSARVGVLVTALLNTCALSAAAFALVDAGRHFAVRLGPNDHDTVGSAGPRSGTRQRSVPLAPMVVGVVSATLLVFVAFGTTEPWMTNGYADPIWSLAAVGAVAYGLQMNITRSNQGVALILLLVAGTAKNEGVLTAGALIALVAFRWLVTMSRDERRRGWWRPIVVGAVELAVVGVWPLVMRIIHARGESGITYSPWHDLPGRARATYDGMAPYLHVVVLAAPLAVVGGLVLSRVRRQSGAANDWWAWFGLTSGLVVVAGAIVTGTASVQVWLVGTVDRVTEFPALTAWWIVAMWAVVASGALFVNRRAGRERQSGISSLADAVVDAPPEHELIRSHSAAQ